MWVRKAFFVWLVPSAFVLPLWLVVGWAVFQPSAWVFLWVLFIAVPSVLVGQLVLTLLIRMRPAVRSERAVSWWDAAGITLWHGLTIAVGFYAPAWFVPALVAAIAAGLALFWVSIWQILRDARTSGERIMLRYAATSGPGADSGRREDPDARAASDVFIVTEGEQDRRERD
ncbi:MFS transporter permease [Microbacterium sp. LRZ72]|uniref:MFS transporter permease n=1 Tax=Microbacterium sp. LRZ72 TaxID=2942481 RepID=UPI0029BC88D0|nr:MFS transporter permease [Microbacterium sp. LRZ72]MDX2375574.1 MFS transporter permease [Microbacterium sp. LRZ72]